MDMQSEQHLERLLFRCSEFAASYLSALGDHPRLPQILERLDRIDGPIFRIDIEKELEALGELFPPS